jgi:hypothetical protein
LVVTSAETVEFNFTRSDVEHRAGRRKAEYGGRRGRKRKEE